MTAREEARARLRPLCVSAATLRGVPGHPTYTWQRAYTWQRDYDVCCEWGPHGVSALTPTCDVAVIVDVLSFSSAVDIATARGAVIFPYPWRDASTAAFAASVDALVAGDNELGLTLKPHSLESIAADCRLVLPSPNGSNLSTLTGSTPTLAGSLRNCAAVAGYAATVGRRIAVIPAGEIWPDGSLRPAFEDQCGAGAIIHHLPAGLSRSPEALAAAAVYENATASGKEPLLELLRACASGREKQERRLDRDVELVAELNTSACVPLLEDGAYRNGGT
jgi:2-phosphosulfolactate phosphatase